MNRRHFIKNLSKCAGGMCAAPYVITSNALGNNNIPPVSDRITLGHIGVGGQGSGLLRNFLQVGNAQSIAVCDAFRSRREDRAKQIDAFYSSKGGNKSYKSCKVFRDFRDLLARDDIDAVIIATPDHWHVPIGMLAVEAAKDIYIEKPLGVSIAETLALRSAVQERGRVFQYGTQQRSGRNFRFACELVRNGRIGQLQTIHAWCADISSQESAFHLPGGSMIPIPVPDELDYDMWIGPAPMSPYTSDRCTPLGTYHVYDNSLGFIAGWGAHPLDIAQWGNDTDNTAPVVYEGKGTIAKRGLYDTVSSWDMLCQYENGVEMRFMNTEAARPIVQKYHPRFRDHGTTFLGSEGWVSVDRSNVYANPKSLLDIHWHSSDVHLYESHNHYQNFVDCVQTRKTTISTIEAAVQSDIISHLCDIAIRLKKKIRWDPVKETIIADDMASRMLVRSYRSPWRL